MIKIIMTKIKMEINRLIGLLVLMICCVISSYSINDCVPTNDFSKSINNPVIDLGSSGTWDDAVVAREAIYYDGTTWYVFYGGGTDATHRQEISVGLSYGSDLDNLTKHVNNPVIDRADVGYGSADYGIYPASVFKIDDMYYMSLDLIINDGSDISLGMMNSTDLIHWSNLTVLSGGVNDGYDDRARIKINPNNENELIMFWMKQVTSYQIGKANASIDDPYSWNVIDDAVLDNGNYLIGYPEFFINNDGSCNLYYSTAPYITAYYVIKETYSSDCLNFELNSSNILIPSVSGFDSTYVTGSANYRDIQNQIEYMFYQGRTTGSATYIGIGYATRDLTCSGYISPIITGYSKILINAEDNTINNTMFNNSSQYYSTTSNIVNWLSIVWGDL